MKTDLLRFFAVATILGANLYAQSQLLDVPLEGLPSVADDPEWQRRFLGSYGFMPALEPKVTQEELETLRDLIELMKVDTKAAARQLAATVNDNSSPALIFILGNLYFQDGQLEDAENYYLEAVEKHPSFRRAHKNLGLLYMQVQDYDSAIKYLGRAAELGEHDGRTHGLMGFAYLAKEDYLAAEEAYRDAIQQEPSVKDWRLGLARSLLATERYKESVALFDALLVNDPTDTTLWLLQSNAYLGLGRPLDAAVNLEVVRSIGSPKHESLLLLGDIYLNLGMPELALEVYQQAIADDETGGGYKAALRAAQLLQQTGASIEAAQLLETIQVRYEDELTNDQQLEILTLQAKIARREGQTEKAAQLLESIVKRDGTSGEALIELADHFYQEGDIERAYMYIERAQNLEDFEYDALVKHAQFLAKKRNYQEAALLLKRALNIKDEPRVERFLAQVERAAK